MLGMDRILEGVVPLVGMIAVLIFGVLVYRASRTKDSTAPSRDEVDDKPTAPRRESTPVAGAGTSRQRRTGSTAPRGAGAT
jgi:hypothetical protein